MKEVKSVTDVPIAGSFEKLLKGIWRQNPIPCVSTIALQGVASTNMPLMNSYIFVTFPNSLRNAHDKWQEQAHRRRLQVREAQAVPKEVGSSSVLALYSPSRCPRRRASLF